MSILRDFEKRLEGAVEGFFARAFRSGLQPVELAKAVQRYAGNYQQVGVDGVLYMQVLDPGRASYGIGDYQFAISQLAQTTLRSVLGQHELDDMLAERDKLNTDIQAILDQRTDNWGIKVANVEIKHVDIDESMVRAIARQAEAERNRRARIIDAEGEQQAAAKLVEAADQLSSRPEAMTLRYFSTLYSIANERSNTIVFPLPTSPCNKRFIWWPDFRSA